MQQIGLNRNTIDKFYTKNEIVELCINLIIKNIDISKENDLIIEPSAGNGSFINKIKSLSNNYKFYDIEPNHNEIEKLDFLTFDINNINNNNIHIIGNPPFGRQSSLVIKFIKIFCKFANSISIILPKSFKKESLKKYFGLNYHLINEIDLPENSFVVNDKEHNVPCIFQIWLLKPFMREIITKIEPINFKFVKKNNKPDISFRRVGVNAGNISIDIDNKNIQTHYFIKFINNLTIEENIEKLKSIKFDFNNTVGPKSISKYELIKKTLSFF
jgi:hypothetical protein